MCQRSVDIKHFLGDAFAALGIIFDSSNRATSLGQFNQGYAHVVDQGNQHFADIVFLPVRLTQHRRFTLVLKVANRTHSHDALDQDGDLRTEIHFDLIQGDSLFADRPVENSSNQAVGAHMQIRQDLRNVQPRKKTIRLAGPVRKVQAFLVARTAGNRSGLAKPIRFLVCQCFR